MGQEQPASWYDQAYRTTPHYQGLVSESPFLPLWEAIAARVEPQARVLDLGCGTGQFAAIVASKVQWYLGIDFSTVAIDLAMRRHPLPARLKPHLTFWLANLAGVEGEDIVRTYSPCTVVACEVLEHLGGFEDKRLLRAAGGSHIIASLPTRDSESHVRFFPTETDVLARYGDIRSNWKIDRVDQWWVMESKP